MTCGKVGRRRSDLGKIYHRCSGQICKTEICWTDVVCRRDCLRFVVVGIFTDEKRRLDVKASEMEYQRLVPYRLFMLLSRQVVAACCLSNLTRGSKL